MAKSKMGLKRILGLSAAVLVAYVIPSSVTSIPAAAADSHPIDGIGSPSQPAKGVKKAGEAEKPRSTTAEPVKFSPIQVLMNSGEMTDGQQAFRIYSFSTGSQSVGNWASPYAFMTTSDTLKYLGNNYVDGLHIEHNFGGPGTIGSRTSLLARLTQTAPTSNRDNLRQYYVGGVLSSSVSFNEGGRPGFSHPAGSAVGANIISQCNAGATYFYTCNGEEVDVEAASATRPAHKFGVLYVLSGEDADQGVYDDAAIAFSTGSTKSLGWKLLFQVGKSDAVSASSSSTSQDTTLMGCRNGHFSCAIGTGIDLDTNWVWRDGYAWMSPGVRISANGTISARSVELAGLSVAQLPACDKNRWGTIAFVIDASDETYAAALKGGGDIQTLALCTNKGWRQH